MAVWLMEFVWHRKSSPGRSDNEAARIIQNLQNSKITYPCTKAPLDTKKRAANDCLLPFDRNFRCLRLLIDRLFAKR